MKTTALTLALLLVVAAPALAQEGRWGVLARKDGVGQPYALTAEDALWAARMVVGESGGKGGVDDAAVLWCMINSYMLRPVRDAYPTFSAFVRAYCTPLQPHLKAQGAIDRHRRRGTPMVEVEPGKWQLRRHVELQERPWAELPASARGLVERVFRGELPSPCANATQFCSTATYYHDRHGRRPTDEEHVEFTEAWAREKGYAWVRVEGADPRSNCFFVEKRFASLPEGVVVVQPAGRRRT
ncbi:MAG: hypothetical protein KIT58_18760 [Planctomycetota bacterium]|nr:hypothetical protein [Planctomycetota bacterium]